MVSVCGTTPASTAPCVSAGGAIREGAEGLPDKVIDLARRFEDTHRFDRKHRVEHIRDSGVFDRTIEHLGRAIREDRRAVASLFQPSEHVGHFRIGSQFPVERQETLAKLGVSIETCGLEREVDVLRAVVLWLRVG